MKLRILPKPKKYDIKFNFAVSGTLCYISHDYGTPPASENTILVHSAVLFVKRYLYIADRKQKEPMRQILLEFLPGKKIDYLAMMDATERMIYESLGGAQRKALAGYATSGGDLPAFLIDKPLDDATGWAEFYLVNSRGKWSERFYLKLGYDRVVLSRLVVLMIQYIDQHLKSDDERQNFHTVLLSYIDN